METAGRLLYMTTGHSFDPSTVDGFGYEWTKFDQSDVPAHEQETLFGQYFSLFPWDNLPPKARGFDLGCGSGRWARLVAPRVGHVLTIDASKAALKVATYNAPRCRPLQASAGALPLRSSSMDFGYSLGVLHHIPDPQAGLADAVRVLKPGAPFLVYLYYAFDNRPTWYRKLWQASDLVRRLVSRFPMPLRYSVSQVVAGVVYWPLARSARLVERTGRDVDTMPLTAYRNRSFYAMRTDALDRFGTRLERRFTKLEVRELLTKAGLERIQISDEMPYWCAVGVKAPATSEVVGALR